MLGEYKIFTIEHAERL